MSDCRRTADRMTPYVDGMLSPSDRATVDRHLHECPPCRHAVDEADRGRAVLQRASRQLERPPLPPGLETRCQALAAAHATRRRVGGWVGRLVPGAAIVMLVLTTALILAGMATRRSNVVLAQQLTMDHVKCFRWFAPSDGHSADAHVLEEMLATKYGWDVHVPPSSGADGITLTGARRCLYVSGTIPHVMYRVGDEEMSLFVLDGEQRAPADLETLGHRSRIWSDRGNTYVLVSAHQSEALDQAAEYLMDQERSR